MFQWLSRIGRRTSRPWTTRFTGGKGEAGCRLFLVSAGLVRNFISRFISYIGPVTGAATLTGDSMGKMMTSTKDRPIRLTVHAQSRMDQMMVDEEEVFDTIRRPEYTYPLHPERHGVGTMCVRGRLAIPVSDTALAAPESNPLVVRTVLWALSESREAGPTRRPVTDQMQTQSVVPARPSNRNFYNKLVLWGFKMDSHVKDMWRMKRELGGETLTIDIRPPKHSAGPLPTTFVEAYKMLGVTDEEFWGRDTPIPKPKELVVSKSAPKPKLGLPPQPTYPDRSAPKVAAASDPLVPVVIDREARKMVSPRTLAVLAALPPDGTPISLRDIVTKAGLSRRDAGNAAEGLHRTSGFVERSSPATYRFSRPVRFEPPLPSLAELSAQLETQAPDARPRGNQALNQADAPIGDPIVIDLARIQGPTRDFLAAVPVDGSPLSAAELRERTGLEGKSFYNAVDRMVRSGRMVKHGTGLYGFAGPVTFVNGDSPPTHLKPAATATPESKPVSPNGVKAPMSPLVEAAVRREAEASVRLDGETQSFGVSDVPPVPAPQPRPPAVIPAAPAPKPVAVAKVPDMEAEIDSVFDLLFPDGLMVRSTDFGTVAQWREATKLLLELRR